MSCRVAAVNVSPYIAIVQIISPVPLGSLISFSNFENRLRLKPVLGDNDQYCIHVLITGHVQVQLNKVLVCYCLFFGV